MNNVENILKRQDVFFESGKTKDLEFRKSMLKVLYSAINKHEEEIMQALKEDLNKEPFEAYATEIGLVLEEISFMLKNMKKLLKPKRVRTPLAQFPSVSKVYRDPYGKVLIMSPWNYPFLLNISPLVGSIACGNCSIIKPSNYAPASSAIIKKIIEENFDPDYISVIEGGREVNQNLLDNKFDLIFFTGSSHVARVVMEKASKNLTPLILELGGKSPCIVDETANIELAAKRIAWGKAINSGQTCVAPDYVLVHESVKDQLVEGLKKSFTSFYGENSEKNPSFPKIINKKHFDRLSGLVDTCKIIYGGGKNPNTNQIGLTLVDDVDWDDPIMSQEIFGPILPLISYNKVDEIIEKVTHRPKPLALYLFTTSKKAEKKIINSISYGGGCINDTLVHLATAHMGFGGVGESGMGSYHGRDSIEAFSHKKSVLKKANWLDIPIRYSPYGKKINILKKVVK